MNVQSHMVHLYCILPQAARAAIPPGLIGIAGARVRALALDRVVAWVSDLARGPAAAVTGINGHDALDGIKAHDAVVEAALSTGSTPVPARFGQRFENDDACRGALARRAEAVTSLVSAVQGFVEMTLLVTPSTRRMLRDLEPVVRTLRDRSEPESFEPSGGGAGRAYLDSLRARDRSTRDVRIAAEALAARVSSAVAALVTRSAEHQAVTRLPMLTVSHLIRREGAATYRDTAVGVPTGGELRLLVIGPRAPYSFCALSADNSGSHGMNLAD